MCYPQAGALFTGHRTQDTGQENSLVVVGVPLLPCEVNLGNQLSKKKQASLARKRKIVPSTMYLTKIERKIVPGTMYLEKIGRKVAPDRAPLNYCDIRLASDFRPT